MRRRLETGRLAQRALLDNQPPSLRSRTSRAAFSRSNKVFADACGQAFAEALVGKTDAGRVAARTGRGVPRDDTAVMAAGRQKAVEETIAGVDGIR